MEIIKNQVDDLNIELTIALKGEDYAEQSKKRLSAYKRNADIKGFRKGMAPASLIKRLYGDQALYEAINGIVAEQLDKFIKDNDLNILGEPLGSESQKELEWKEGNDFEFKFDLGLSPEVKLSLGAEDTIPYYKIAVSEEAKAKMKNDILNQFGQMQETQVAGATDYLVVDFKQGEKKEENVYVAMDKVEGEAKDMLVGAAAGESFDIDVNAAFTNEADRASMLRVKKEELEGMDPLWNLTIVNIKTFVAAPLTQETFDKVFGEGVVKTVEEFDAKVAQRVASDYKQEADYYLSQDIRKYLVDKADIKLPEAFLKRWLFEINKEKFTMEDIEKDFAGFLVDFRWQLVCDALMKEYDLKVEDNDLIQAAKSYTAYQYAMYGMPDVPDTFLTESAMKLLQDEKQLRNLRESVEKEKVVEAVRGKVSLKEQEISLEAFRALK